MTERLPAVRLSALREGLDPEVQAFARLLRELFAMLRLSVRRYAALSHRDPGAVSRYLSGERLPKRPFLDELLAELAATKGAAATDEVRSHLYELYFKALRARDSGAYQVEVVRDQLRDATVTLRQTMLHVKSLEQTLDARQREVDELNVRLREMEQAWAADRLRSQEELEAVRLERDRLQGQITVLLEQLQWAQNRQAEAEERCQDLEDRLQVVDALPAARPTVRIRHNLPPRNARFVGREGVLAGLRERTGPQVLLGPAGVGKSEVAAEYAHRHADDYDLVCWIPAERADQVQQAYTDLAARLGLETGRQVNSAVPAARAALRDGSWLLIFDNAVDVEEIKGFFPDNGPGEIIVTSRNGVWAEITEPLVLDVFTREESLALLGQGTAATDELAAALGDLPLALDQALTWLADTKVPVEEYLAAFRAHHNEVTELLADASPAPAELLAAAFWVMSLRRLSDDEALNLLQLCAFVAPEPVSLWLLSGVRNVDGPAALLEVLGDEVKLGRVLRKVDKYGLARVGFAAGTIAVDPLLQRLLRRSLSAAEAERLRHCVHQILANADPRAPNVPAEWERYARLLPHVRHSQMVGCADAWSRRLVLNLIDFLWQWGDHQAYLELARNVVDAWTAAHGAGDGQTLAASLHLGCGLRIAGRFGEAYKMHLSAWDQLAAKFGPDDERTLDARKLLAVSLHYLGRYGEAHEIARSTLEMVQGKYGPADPLTLDHAHVFALELRFSGDARSAAELDRETWQRKVCALGEDHLRTLSTRSALAADNLELGHCRQARAEMAQIVEELGMLVHQGHPFLAENLRVLSAAERLCGSYERALELSELALARFRQRYGETYFTVISVELDHMVNLRHVGDLTAAFELGQQTLGRHEAQALNTEALEALSAALGPDHPYSLKCTINLASDMFALGDLDGAFEADQATMSRAVHKLGSYHPIALACALNRAIDLRAIDRPDEVEREFAEVTARHRRLLGADHPLTVRAARQVRAHCEITPIPA